MSFNGGIDLLFHIGVGVFLIRILVFLFSQKNYILGRTSFLLRNAEECQYFFLTFFTWIQGVVAGIGDPGRRHRRRLQI
jgi:hypothetical protein